MVTPDGTISTIAGGNLAGYFGDGRPASRAIFASILSLARDSKGNLYLADVSNQMLHKLDRFQVK